MESTKTHWGGRLPAAWLGLDLVLPRADPRLCCRKGHVRSGPPPLPLDEPSHEGEDSMESVSERGAPALATGAQVEAGGIQGAHPHID